MLFHIFVTIVVTASLWAWAVAHQLLIYYGFAVLVDQLPKPTGTSQVYAYFFGVMHVAAANLNRAKMGVTTKPEEKT